MVKFRLHPLFLGIIILLVLTGNIAMYSIIFVSLLLHELGHIMVAMLLKVRIERCTLMPYGGQILLKDAHTVPYSKQLLIACGGPLVTAICFIYSGLLPEPFDKPFSEVQFVLLVINCIPLLPLDGGKIICNSLLILFPKTKIYEAYVSISFAFLTITAIITLVMLPQSIFLAVLSLLLWSEVIGEWRYRKYRSAFLKIVMKRLT
ncbi:site-2 protease family protein [Lysinibacillus sp. 54212]|uniref:site-2 protease family protein n=1 Tax=Lysinibacillus sp. 54212 TaxID=3119829 RepID=UPI002FC6A61F